MSSGSNGVTKVESSRVRIREVYSSPARSTFHRDMALGSLGCVRQNVVEPIHTLREVSRRQKKSSKNSRLVGTILSFMGDGTVVLGTPLRRRAWSSRAIVPTRLSKLAGPVRL